MTGRHQLWLDPGFGASGDMLLGCLVGLGAPLASITEALSALGFDNDTWSIEQHAVTRNSLSATRTEVRTEESHHHRTWSSIDAMLAEAAENGALPSRVADGARRTFRRLGEVEADMHAVSIDEVHFHEVGAVDAIVDIVGVWLALDELRRTYGDVTVSAGPVGLGQGTVKAAHGLLPIPAPATAALLTGAPIAANGQGETVTPTGAALLTTIVDDWRQLPMGTLIAVSRGAGGRDPDDYPNVVTGYLVEAGDSTQAASTGAAAVTTVTTAVLTTNLDDVTGEVLAHTIDQCLSAGADDAWAQPIVMKKGRPGHSLSVMCRPDLADKLRDLIMVETGSLGIRRQLMTKQMSPRTTTTVEVQGHPVRIKVGRHHAKPEFDDLADVARLTGLPLKQLAKKAMTRYVASTSECTDKISPDLGYD